MSFLLRTSQLGSGRAGIPVQFGQILEPMVVTIGFLPYPGSRVFIFFQ